MTALRSASEWVGGRPESRRHALADTDGHLLQAAFSPASTHDSHGEITLLRRADDTWPGLKRCFADPATIASRLRMAYKGERVATASATAVTVVDAQPGQKGFAVQPRRWAIECSFSHTGR